MDVLDVLLEVLHAFVEGLDVGAARSFSSTPPCIFKARTVATITTAPGTMPALRHLMSMNFSAPRSAPKPASVTV